MIRRLVTMAILGALAASPALAAPAPPPAVAALDKAIDWDSSKDGAPKTYLVGDLKLTLSVGAPAKDETAPPVLTLQSPVFGRKAIKGPAGLTTPMASLMVTRLDPKAAGPVVAFGAFTGGAHCCEQIYFLDPVAAAGPVKTWAVVNAGQWDGDFITKTHHLPGDPTPYIQMVDNNFLYAFACYACATAPPKVLTLVGAQWRDVSTDPKYAPVFRKDEAQARKICGEGGGGQDGACAIFAADAARLGELDRAWPFLLQSYDRKDDWAWPTGCSAPRTQHQCPKGHKITFKTYPEALRNFLREQGYLPQG